MGIAICSGESYQKSNNFLSGLLGFLFEDTGAIHTLPKLAYTGPTPRFAGW